MRKFKRGQFVYFHLNNEKTCLLGKILKEIEPDIFLIYNDGLGVDYITPAHNIQTLREASGLPDLDNEPRRCWFVRLIQCFRKAGSK